jgi:hypothetical protein
MGLPTPENGLVVSYSYLWRNEAGAGLLEGRKNRPCAIVLVIQKSGANGPLVTVAPITHSQPKDPAVALEIPSAVKKHLRLDGERSWVILDEFNVFTWPGFDLASVAGAKERYDYGFIPPSLFRKIIEKFIELRRQKRTVATLRNDA